MVGPAEPLPFAGWLTAKLGDAPEERSALADALGIHPSQVSRWLSGRSQPSEASLAALAEHFKTPFEELRRLVRPSRPRPRTLSDLGAQLDRIEAAVDEIRAQQITAMQGGGLIDRFEKIEAAVQAASEPDSDAPHRRG